MQACTTRQLAQLIGAPESSTRRRLGQLVKARLLTASPAIAGATGHGERDYSMTAANCRKLADVAPWIIAPRPSKRRKQAAVPHRRAVNECWMSLEVALRAQERYWYSLFPASDYDATDEEAPTYIQAPDRSRRTSAELAVASDFTLIVSSPTGSSLLFGELDMGSEIVDSSVRSRPTLVNKLEAYAAFHDSDGYKRLGDRLGERFSGFRVLVITKSGRRVANIRKKCARLGDTGFVWMTSLSHIAPGTVLGPIWQTGGSPRPCRLLRHGR